MPDIEGDLAPIVSQGEKIAPLVEIVTTGGNEAAAATVDALVTIPGANSEALPGVKALAEVQLPEVKVVQPLGPAETAVNLAATKTTVVGGENQTASSQIVEAIKQPTPEMQAKATQYSSEQMAQWDKKHPEPNKETDAQAHAEWEQQRANMVGKAEVEGSIQVGIEAWEKDNPKPDVRDKKFDSWAASRKQKEDQLRKQEEQDKEAKNGKEDDKKKDKKKESDEKLSDIEVWQKIKQLAELYDSKNRLDDGVKAIESKADKKSQDDKITLGKFEINRIAIKLEISAIENELIEEAESSGIVRQMLIYALMGGARGSPIIRGVATEAVNTQV